MHVSTTGPFAGQITGGNLVEVALERLSGLGKGLTLGAVVLAKNLPVAAGLGGGSADAAAVLRAVRAANPDRAGEIAWHDVAAGLGADVPVCLAGRPALMWGIGDRIEPLTGGLPGLPAVLVNPRVPLPTADVFAALRATPAPAPRRPDWPVVAEVGVLLEVMRARANDLERPATLLLPAIADIKAALAAQRGCLHAALSGSGPTCFGIFNGDPAAARAAATLAAHHPGWWVVATRLAGSIPA